jgi:single-stranded DNA-binding protein
MNSVVLVGNIAGDIYFNHNGGRPLLRLLLFSGHPRLITGLRVVLLDGRAKGFYASLRKGSEIGVIGHLITRRHERSFVAEVEARNLVLLRSFSWSDIDTRGTIVEQGDDKVVVEGTIGPDILFEWRQRKTGKFLGVNDQYAFLQFDLFNNTHPEGLNIVAYGFVAELIFPYLRPKSGIAVDGLLRQDKGGWRVVVAENVALLRNIDYIRAAAAQSRLVQMWEIDEKENLSG